MIWCQTNRVDGSEPALPGSSEPTSGKGAVPAEQPGAFATASLLVGIAAVILAAVVVGNARHLAAGLLIFAALTLIVLWAFGHARRSPWYSLATTGILVVLLAGGAWHLYQMPAGQAAGRGAPRPKAVKAPKLYFQQGQSASVPWCASYIVQATGSVPAGYQVVMFDASADDKGNVTSHYSYDQQAKSTGAVPGQYEDKNVFIGARFAPMGYPAVVVAVVIKDSEAALLNDIGAYKNEWGLATPPANLASASLQVTRNGGRAYCPGTKPKT
jgi:hypothetical protein